MIRKANIRYSWKGFAIPLLLSALLLLTACTDYDALLPTKAEEPSQAERLANADTLFLNLSIVSNSNVTRAAEVGTSAENAIYDGILCIFEGNGETNATLKNATAIDQLISNPNEPRPTILSSSSSIDIVQRLPIGTHPYPNGGKLYALVLLNTTSTGFTVSNNMLYLNGASLAGKTRAEIQAMPINSVGSTDEHTGLFMMNKPKDSGQLVIQVYDPSWTDQCYLYDSEEAITQSTYTKKKLTINVERAAARIKLTNDIPASKALSNIHLNAVTTAHPLIHKMTWALASELPGNTEATGANIFSLFHQHSHESGEAVYVAENTATPTSIVVELQLKDESNVLLGDCYSFPSLNGYNLYTSVDELIEFYKSKWDERKDGESYTSISSWSDDDVFRNTKVTILNNGSVKVSLLTDENYTSATVTDAQRIALQRLEGDLSYFTQGYRDGKMYFTYSVSSVQHNNAYNLSLVEKGSTDTRYVAVTFNNQNGQGWAASFSNNSANLFTTSRVVVGSNMNYNGWDTNFGQAKYNPTAEHSSPTVDDKIDFLFDPEEGWTFTPTRVAFNTTSYDTDGGIIDVYWLNSGLATNVPLATGVVPPRDNKPVNVLTWNRSVTAGSVGDGECGLRLLLYGLKTEKQVGFSDIVISGTLSKESTESSQKSINGVGNPTP
ncbi:MAG: hypothetical protein J5797_11935 [Prevotella sp.]|nr:hypothetical protein [Prevotella sp.]